ncbi:MAG: hypothetical protein F4Z77_04440 [Dehalococcoidia bacterium]|nr:hypothetical protein [Dehalococcoidia bacterium]MYA52077.1 hypothetical protein [Dehalococcoidia bacterium]
MSPSIENEETGGIDDARARELRERDARTRVRDLVTLREDPFPEDEELSITHGEYLYDEHGLPKGEGNFALTDIESALPPPEAD